MWIFIFSSAAFGEQPLKRPSMSGEWFLNVMHQIASLSANCFSAHLYSYLREKDHLLANEHTWQLSLATVISDEESGMGKWRIRKMYFNSPLLCTTKFVVKMKRVCGMRSQSVVNRRALSRNSFASRKERRFFTAIWSEFVRFLSSVFLLLKCSSNRCRHTASLLAALRIDEYWWVFIDT